MELTPCPYCHIALAKASVQESPDSRGGETDPASVGKLQCHMANGTNTETGRDEELGHPYNFTHTILMRLL